MKATNFLTVIAIIMLLATSCGQQQPKPAEEVKVNILSWLRMPADEFGCMMEKTFGHRDARFNCSLTNYKNEGDPCDKWEEWYEGPKFPENLVKKVHPWMKSINIDWEGGMMQAASFSFDEEHSEAEILSEFGIDPDNLPNNINWIDAQDSFLYIEGFMHMGAGDVGCDDDEESEEL